MGEVSGNWTNSGACPVSGARAKNGCCGSARCSSAGKEIVIPVNVQGVADKEVIAYEFNLIYDPAVIQPLADPVALTGTVSRGLSVVTNPYTPGLLRVVVYGAYPIDENGVLLNLRFMAVGAPGSISPLTFERIMFNDGDIGILLTDGQVEIR